MKRNVVKIGAALLGATFLTFSSFSAVFANTIDPTTVPETSTTVVSNDEVEAFNLDVLTDLKKSYAPGETFSLKLAVRNTLDVPLRSVEVLLEPEAKSPFATDAKFPDSVKQTIDLRNGEEKVITFPLSVKQKAADGSFDLPVLIKAPAANGSEQGYTALKLITLSIKKPSPTPPVQTTPTCPTTTETPKSTAPIEVPNKNNGLNISDLQSSDNINYTPDFVGYAPSGGGYDISMQNSGDFGSGSGLVKNKPKLIVTKYVMNPTIAQAGEEFELILTFKNTNQKKAVSNIKISLDSGETGSAPAGLNGSGTASTAVGNTFTPVDSSNTLYIAKIEPDKTVEQKIKFFVGPNTPSQNYSLLVTMEYEDPDGMELTAKESIGIPVVQTPKLDTDEINVPTEVSIDEPINIDFGIYNTGKDSLSNVMIQAVGDFQADPERTFVGNFQPGATAMFSTSLYANQEGTLNGSIKVTFEDSKGMSHEVIKDFTTEIITKEIFGPDGLPLDPDMPPQGMPEGPMVGGSILNNPIVWIVLAILVAGGVATVIIISRRKHKRNQQDLTLHE